MPYQQRNFFGSKSLKRPKNAQRDTPKLAILTAHSFENPRNGSFSQGKELALADLRNSHMWTTQTVDKGKGIFFATFCQFDRRSTSPLLIRTQHIFHKSLLFGR
jgi:hypothetical protein